jgi:hypothetical protein
MSSTDMPLLPLVATPRLPRIWYFWGSTVFGLLAHGVALLAQMLTLVAVLIRYGGAEPSEATLTMLVHQGGTIAVATVVACPAMLAVLWIAIRMARRRIFPGRRRRPPCSTATEPRGMQGCCGCS